MIQVQTQGVAQAHASLSLLTAHLEDMSARLDEASDYIYEATRQRFDSEGDGDWPQLAESTVAKKESQGYGEPSRILYAEGNLYESATSPNGPYSQRIHINAGVGLEGKQSVVMIVDFENDGWQIPSLLAEGDSKMPSRPIWPPDYEVQGPVGEILMRGL